MTAIRFNFDEMTGRDAKRVNSGTKLKGVSLNNCGATNGKVDVIYQEADMSLS